MIMSRGVAFAGTAGGSGRTGCCSTAMIGFKQGHKMFEKVLNPAATCVVMDKCRGSSARVMFEALADMEGGIMNRDSHKCVCSQGIPINTHDSAIVKHDLSDPNGTRFISFSICCILISTDLGWDEFEHLVRREIDVIPDEYITPVTESQSTTTQKKPIIKPSPSQTPATSKHDHRHAHQTKICLLVPSTTVNAQGIYSGIAARNIYSCFVR